MAYSQALQRWSNCRHGSAVAMADLLTLKGQPMKVNAIAALAALALSSSLALAQSDQNTSINGPAATQRGVENMQNGGRNLGDPSTMKNDGDYMQACKPLSAEARKDCMAQAKRDGMSSEPGQSRTTDRDAMGKQSDKR